MILRIQWVTEVSNIRIGEEGETEIGWGSEIRIIIICLVLVI